jgi:plastocyanin
MGRRAGVFAALMLVMAALPLAPARAGGFCHEGGTTQEDTSTVDMKGDCFLPTVAHINVGDSITWRNLDSVEHIVVGAGGSWGTSEIAPNAVTALRFNKPGVYPYWCHFHLGMVGAVVVGNGRPTASASGGSGDGPVATLAFTGEETADGSQPENAGAADAPVDARAVASAGIDWVALAVAAGLIALTALILSGSLARAVTRSRAKRDQEPAPST